MLQLSFKGNSFLFLFIRKKASFLLAMLWRVRQSKCLMTVFYSTVYKNMTSVNEHIHYESQRVSDEVTFVADSLTLF